MPGVPKKLYRILKLNFGAENIYAVKMFIFAYSRNFTSTFNLENFLSCLNELMAIGV